MKTLKFLGTDSGFGELNNSAYFESEDEFTLIDCGFTVFPIIKEKFDWKKYTSVNVIITHLHDDHCGSLAQFVMYLWFCHGKKVNVITRCKHIEERLLNSGAIPDEYQITDKFKDIKFIETKHVKELDCYGFFITLGDKKIVYTGDTQSLDAFMPFLNDCQELYVDVSKNGGVHIKFEEAFETLKTIKSNGTEVYLMHIDDKKYIRECNKEEFFMA